MTTTDSERIVRSALAAPAQLPEDAMTSLGDERTLSLLAATTALAIRRKFTSRPPRSQVDEYVQDLKARFPEGADFIKPLVIESLIRFAFGESDAAGGVASQDLRAALFVLPYAVISEEDLDEEPLNEFITEVLTAVDSDDQ